MEVDLTALDDWLGTLEKLQLGLERPNSHTNGNPSTTQRSNGKPPSCASHLYNIGTKSPTRKAGLTVNLQALSPPPLSPAVRSGPGQDQRNTKSGQQTVEGKDASAEGDLNNLIRDLQVVEERMRVLEQDDTTACQRFSLSSPLVDSHRGSCDPRHPENPCLSSSPLGNEPRLVSAQWAAKLNHDRRQLQTAKLSPHNGTSYQLAQHRVASSGLLWCPSGDKLDAEEKSVSASQTTLVNAPTNPCSLQGQMCPPITLADVEQGSRQGMSSPAPPTRYLTKPVLGQNQQALMEQLRVFQGTGGSPTAGQQLTPSQLTFNQLETIDNQSIASSPDTSRGNPVLVETFSTGSSQLSTNPVGRTSVTRRTPSSLRPLLVVPPNGINGSASKAERSPLMLASGEASSGQLRPERSPGNGDAVGDSSPRGSSVFPFGPDRLSSSLSPESSLSERSLSEATEYSRRSDCSTDSSNARRPIFVRVFRPDRTTKAVLVEENTTAGEMASILIEKNFSQPSTSLVLVEKVPSMKIERIFEEHQRVADCILSWSTRSQNMLFFEDRSEQFGFIQSPSKWLGDSFVQKHGYQSSESLQHALENLNKMGFPEYRDYLYIKKPGEKSWSRRLCVLRSSGLYTSKKSKKSLNPSDLIRILILDSQLQLYTTTGGWSRMRAPTPHGFAFKPYSDHDLSSKHVFCFCAADEMALRQWVCRFRIAKYGRQLLTDYRTANERVQRLSAIRQGSFASSLLSLSTSPLSVQLHRKSVIEMLGSGQPSTLSAAESTSSLVSSTDSPSVIQRLSPEHGRLLHSPNGRTTPEKHVNWARLGRQSPSPMLVRLRNSDGGNRASADCTPNKHEAPPCLKQSMPVNDLEHMHRLPNHGYSLNSYYASPRLMNGNHLLSGGAVQRPRI